MKLFAVLALAAVAFADPTAEGDRAPASARIALGGAAYGYGAPNYPYAGAYYGTYRPYPSPFSSYSYGKRSAEADPALLYGSYGYGAYPYGYRTYGAHGAYPYAHSYYYGKRSAVAER